MRNPTHAVAALATPGALLAAVVVLLAVSTAGTADTPAHDECQAMLAEDPRELAAWLAERNGISLKQALGVVYEATQGACGTTRVPVGNV